jgi:D-amino-acid dehydrogenase
MEGRYEAAVVGGGIVGASTAYHLARAGVETLLIDRHDEGRATDAGAGILSPVTSARGSDDAWFDFAVEAVAYYDELVTALETEQDGLHGYADRGLLRVAIDEEEITRFDDTLSRIRERQAADKPPARGSVHELTPTEARKQFPPLAEPPPGAVLRRRRSCRRPAVRRSTPSCGRESRTDGSGRDCRTTACRVRLGRGYRR